MPALAMINNDFSQKTREEHGPCIRIHVSFLEEVIDRNPNNSLLTGTVPIFSPKLTNYLVSKKCRR